MERGTTWPELERDIAVALQDHAFWGGHFALPRGTGLRECSVHLAIFVEPYLSFVLEGEKTIESRFSAVRCAPYRRVSPGDVVVLKGSGGPVQGVALVDHVWTYDLDPDTWDEVKEFAEPLCARDPSFWESREAASYATLMRLTNVTAVPDLRFKKRDRRGWVVLREGNELPLA